MRCIFLLPLLLLSACNMNKMIHEHTQAIGANLRAINQSTFTIQRNVEIVDQSTEAIRENYEVVKKSSENIQTNAKLIRKTSEAVHLNRSAVSRSTEAIHTTAQRLESVFQVLDRINQLPFTLLFLIAGILFLLLFSPLILSIFLIRQISKKN